MIVESAAVVMVCILAFAAARSAFGSVPPQMFYQSEFGPAVMIATGRGFVDPIVEPGSALAEFLALRAPALDRSSIDRVAVRDPDQFQHRHRYLLTLTGYWWRVAGIAWARLAEVAGVLHALSVLATFVLIRLFAPAAVAGAGALWLALSPLQLAFVPHLRDFSKAPFVIAGVPLLVLLVERLTTRRSLAIAAAAAGAVIGVGIGFRFDVAVMAPLIIACVLLFRGRRPWSAGPDKALIVGVLLLSLIVTAWPVLSRLAAGGSNAFHVILLGYSDWFDTPLGLDPAPYSFLPYYSDEYLQALLRARSLELTSTDVAMPSPAYDAAAQGLWWTWVRHFPADALTRLLAAVNGVLDLGLPGWGWLLGAAIVFAAARSGARRAVLTVVVLLALAGYPSLQFDPRHYFHLQAIPIAALLILPWRAARGVMARRPSPAHAVSWPRAALVTIALCASVTVVATAAARSYQTGHLERELGKTIGAPGELVDHTFATIEQGRWLAQLPAPPPNAAGWQAAYYVAEFRSDGPVSAMAIGLRHREAPQWQPCALTQNLVSGTGVARFLFPVYAADGLRAFDGVEMGPQMRDRLIGFRRLMRAPAVGPLHLRLAADWRARRLYQRLIAEERISADDVRADTASLRPRCGSDIVAIDATLDLAAAIDLRFDDEAERAGVELARFAPLTLAAGDALVARVHVDRGNVVIGLRREDGAGARVAIPRPGLSVAAVYAEAAGVYQPVVESGEPGWRSGLSFTVDRLAVVTAAGESRPARPQ